MGKVHLSDADRLRLAVAIAILRSKPKDVSISSYILDLRARLPPSEPAPPTADYCWKTYALKLERDLEQLQEKCDVQETKLLALGDDPSTGITSSVASANPQRGTDIFPANTSKKKAKTKKNPGSNDVTTAPEQRPRLDPQSIFQGLYDQTNVEIPRNSELLLALYAFDKAATDNGNGSTLLHATLRTLRVISRVLEPALGHPTAKTANHVLFSTLGTALYHVIRGSLPSIGIRRGMMTVLDFQLSDVDKIFDCLIENIFRPIIWAFRRITQAFISDLLGDPPRTSDISENRGTEKSPQHPPVIDCRPDLLRLFQMLVESLCLASSLHNPVRRSDNQDPSSNPRWAISLSSLKAALILEVVHELERNLFTVPCDAGTGAIGPGTEPDYSRGDGSKVLDSMVPDSTNLHTNMKRLVAKDTLWYLCSLMHILADLPIPEGLKSPSGAMLVAGSSAAPTPSLEVEITTHGDGTLLLELLHDAILSALYNLVLKCQPAINQPQKDQDRTLDKHSHYPSREPIADDRYTFSTIQSTDDHDPKATSDSQPMIGRDKVGVLKAGVTLTNGAEGPVKDSQAQGQSLTVNDTESEVGDPSAPNLRALLDNHRPPTLTGGARCDTDHQACDVANQGEPCEVIGLGHRALSENTPELGVYSSDVAGAATECLIDEAGFTMILGVVERYILDPEYTRL